MIKLDLSSEIETQKKEKMKKYKREYMRKWRKENPDKDKAVKEKAMIKYRLKNREK